MTQDAETVARLAERLSEELEPVKEWDGGRVLQIGSGYPIHPTHLCLTDLRDAATAIRSLSARLAAAEARLAELRDRAASIGAGLDMLLAAVRADDPKAEIDLRVRDLAAEVAALQPGAPDANGETK